MSKKIKLRCNGTEHHINEIDLEKLIESTFIVKGGNPPPRPPGPTNLDDVEFPLYEDCRYCDGQVIVTREFAEQAR